MSRFDGFIDGLQRNVSSRLEIPYDQLVPVMGKVETQRPRIPFSLGAERMKRELAIRQIGLIDEHGAEVWDFDLLVPNFLVPFYRRRPFPGDHLWSVQTRLAFAPFFGRFALTSMQIALSRRQEFSGGLVPLPPSPTVTSKERSLSD